MTDSAIGIGIWGHNNYYREAKEGHGAKVVKKHCSISKTTNYQLHSYKL